jgi:hypothetical protein
MVALLYELVNVSQEFIKKEFVTAVTPCPANGKASAARQEM